MRPFFSIIVVSFRAGEKLKETLESIRKQNFTDYEVVVKDAGSEDGSVEAAQVEYGLDNRFRFEVRRDDGIYDGMNQGIELSNGSYLFFLNCGDHFYEDTVLTRVHEAIVKDPNAADIYYGSLYSVQTDCVVTPSYPVNGFSCYRNVPCHQTIFYKKECFAEHRYLQKYRVRGDYEHFLWCYYAGKKKFERLPITVAFYEGGGYSETKANQKRSKQEHAEITGMYMSKGERVRYRMILVLTLSGLRGALARSKHFSKLYNKIKSRLYK